MVKFFKKVVKLLLYLLILAAGIYLMNWCYNQSPFLQGVFGKTVGMQNAVPGMAGDGEAGGVPGGISPGFIGKLSLLLFFGILIVQCFALFNAARIIRGVRKSADSPETKDAKLKNADIFLDLPLYIGLFGTVSSFLLISFSPQSSRLVAYSSTLIGIIFSVGMRVGLLYPARTELLADLLKKGK